MSDLTANEAGGIVTALTQAQSLDDYLAQLNTSDDEKIAQARALWAEVAAEMADTDLPYGVSWAPPSEWVGDDEERVI